MGKKMLINATHPEENRVAIVEDGILTELDIEVAGKEQSRGNVYKAAVVRVEPGLQAAFIDYGGERFGFLQMGEIHPSYFRSGEGDGDNRRPRITDVLRRGQEILVQVVKEERGTKGAALTTFLSLPGRYMVLMPDSDTKGVSRKIEDETQRKKLKEAMASLDLPSNMGYIVRTAGIGQKKEELKHDFNYLVRVWERIREEARLARAPALVYKESNLVIRSIRDYFTAEMDEVLVDDPRVCQEAKDFFQQVMPEYARLVKLHQEKRPIFSRYQIEEQIETISKNKVPLPSGGSIVIDSTEALVAVDVNSGKMAGEQNVESTAYKTNLEAAVETARQLRLRDLGGLIVIDFIDMRDRKHIREIEKALKDSLKYDKARVTVGRISQFGMLEMSRQRIKAALAEGSYLPCPHCDGSGRIKSAEAQAIAFLRKVHGAVAKGQIGRVEGEVPLEVASYLLNAKREELVEMERRHQMMIVIKGRPDFIAGQSELSTQKREKEEIPSFDTPLVAAERLERTPYEAESAPIAPAASAAPSDPLQKATPPESEPLPQDAASPAIDPEASEEGTAAENAEDTGKKKRKRRRRKKKSGDVSLPEDLTAQEDGPEEDLSEEEPAAETAEAAAESVGAGEERKKKRRRRRKKKSAAAGSGLTTAEDLAAEAAVSESNPEPSISTETDRPPAHYNEEAPLAAAVEKPPRRSRPARKRPEAAPQIPTAGADAAEKTAVDKEEANPKPPTADAVSTGPEKTPAPVAKPAAKRPRRTARKKADNHSAPAAGEPPKATDQPPATEPAVSVKAEADTETAKVAPRKPRRPAGKKPAAAAEPATGQESAFPEAPAAADTAAEKPVKRRAPRKKASIAKNPDNEPIPE